RYSSTISLSLLRIRRPPTSPLFPYTTLFRSMRVLSRASPGHAVGLMDRIWFTPPRLRRRPGPEAERWLARAEPLPVRVHGQRVQDRKSTRLNSSHVKISYAVFCLKKKKTEDK